MASSLDEGVTWSIATPTDLVNCNSGFYGVKLPDGRFLVLYKSVTRGVLIVAISDDDGNTWNDYYMTLENQDEGQFSYSAVVLGSDDHIHATYTYNHQQIKHGRFESKHMKYMKNTQQTPDCTTSWSYLGGADAYEVGAKRQRLIDGGASLLLGQPRPLPVVRLRGLPFNCSDGDVFEFFAGLDVVDVLLVRKQGRFSGEAFVVLGVPVQVEYALQKNRHNMGRRYIEVFRCKKQDYYHAVAADVADPCKRSDDLLPSRPMPPIISSVIMKPLRSGKEHLKHTGVLKLRGLPFSASKRNVIEFFRGFSLAEENVHIVVHGDGRATGEAFVEFSSTLEAKAAMNKDKMTLGSRYVELFPSSHEEATRAAIKQR